MSKIPEEALRRIKNETLVIGGKDDQLFAAEYGERATQIIPNAIFHLIENTGHLPQIGQPEIVNNNLLTI